MKPIYIKYKNAFLSQIDCFFQTCKDEIYGHVLSQIFNYFNHDDAFHRSNDISRKVYAHVSKRFMSERSNLYVTK